MSANRPGALGAEPRAVGASVPVSGAITESAIKPVVRRKLHVSLSPDDTSRENQDALELVGDIQLILFSELQRRQLSNGDGIRDMAAFTATVASNACYQYLRSKFPVRTQQENKIRYLLSHSEDFAVWKNEHGAWLCGYAKWNGADRPAVSITGDKDETSVQGRGERSIYEDIFRSVFDDAGGGPVCFHELVLYVMRVRGVRERFEIGDGGGESAVFENLLSDPRPRADAVLESASRLRQIWLEILRLPVRHRKAVLLNLKDPNGDSLIAVLPASGTATIREIAAALEMPAQELAAIWNSLPWDDLRIAESMGITRQQVINLRQSARARLGRSIGRC